MTAEIIAFSDASRRACPPPAPSDEVPLTVKNSRKRKQRREVWREASAAVRYWRARIDFSDAIKAAQRQGLPEGRDHEATDDRNGSARIAMVQAYRAALVRQLLTPAYDLATVKWKVAKLTSERNGFWCLDVKPERIELAIAADWEFLAAHPTHRTKPIGPRS